MTSLDQDLWPWSVYIHDDQYNSYENLPLMYMCLVGHKGNPNYLQSFSIYLPPHTISHLLLFFFLSLTPFSLSNLIVSLHIPSSPWAASSATKKRRSHTYHIRSKRGCSLFFFFLFPFFPLLCVHHQNPTDQSIPSVKSNQTPAKRERERQREKDNRESKREKRDRK